MAPLTRCRATPEGVPTPLMVTHYADRATAGLIVTEATLVTASGRGFPRTPGVWSTEQVEAWKPVTEAVHAKGGRVFCQLWHQGRTAVTALLPEGHVPVGPSALAFTDGYGNPAEAPRELATEEIPDVVASYKEAAKCALEAGFDGVELHCGESQVRG